ncbi:acyltransferase family protein [Pseudorhodoferax sp.]|uniref:acyltransferase family protein n=1 Tax=Pseudorhodoferax sp. TaxID=1993553 RepID=UPI002DD664E2|nr:acyltransferase [Pseudorhodoferax sp.]
MHTAQHPSPSHLQHLDGWRGLAIVGVLVGHFFPIPGINMGRFGVELFFVLSGRLMADILFVRGESLGRFYWRRFSRVYPTLIVFIIVCMVVTPEELGIQPSLKSAVAAATLTLNYLSSMGYSAEVFDHVWSLCIEEHAYLLLGLLTLLWPTARAHIHVLIFAIAIAFMLNGVRLTYLEHQDYYATYWRTDVRGAGILFGCALQVWRSRSPALATSVDGKKVVLAAGAALALSVNPVPDPIKYSIGTAFLAYALVFLDKAPAMAMAVLRNKVLGYFGLASFSLYLWQQPFSKILSVVSPPVALALAVATGLLSFYLVEKRSRKWLNDFANRTFLRRRSDAFRSAPSVNSKGA